MSRTLREIFEDKSLSIPELQAEVKEFFCILTSPKTLADVPYINEHKKKRTVKDWVKRED